MQPQDVSFAIYGKHYGAQRKHIWGDWAEVSSWIYKLPESLYFNT